MRRLALGIALAFFGTAAHAGDFCFNSTSPPNPAPPTNPDVLVVAKRFLRGGAMRSWSTVLA